MLAACFFCKLTLDMCYNTHHLPCNLQGGKSNMASRPKDSKTGKPAKFRLVSKTGDTILVASYTRATEELRSKGVQISYAKVRKAAINEKELPDGWYIQAINTNAKGQTEAVNAKEKLPSGKRLKIKSRKVKDLIAERIEAAKLQQQQAQAAPNQRPVPQTAHEVVQPLPPMRAPVPESTVEGAPVRATNDSGSGHGRARAQIALTKRVNELIDQQAKQAALRQPAPDRIQKDPVREVIQLAKQIPKSTTQNPTSIPTLHGPGSGVLQSLANAYRRKAFETREKKLHTPAPPRNFNAVRNAQPPSHHKDKLSREERQQLVEEELKKEEAEGMPDTTGQDSRLLSEKETQLFNAIQSIFEPEEEEETKAEDTMDLSEDPTPASFQVHGLQQFPGIAPYVQEVVQSMPFNEPLQQFYHAAQAPTGGWVIDSSDPRHANRQGDDSGADKSGKVHTQKSAEISTIFDPRVLMYTTLMLGVIDSIVQNPKVPVEDAAKELLSLNNRIHSKLGILSDASLQQIQNDMRSHLKAEQFGPDSLQTRLAELLFSSQKPSQEDFKKLIEDSVDRREQEVAQTERGADYENPVTDTNPDNAPPHKQVDARPVTRQNETTDMQFDPMLNIKKNSGVEEVIKNVETGGGERLPKRVIDRVLALLPNKQVSADSSRVIPSDVRKDIPSNMRTVADTIAAEYIWGDEKQPIDFTALVRAIRTVSEELNEEMGTNVVDLNTSTEEEATPMAPPESAAAEEPDVPEEIPESEPMDESEDIAEGEEEVQEPTEEIGAEEETATEEMPVEEPVAGVDSSAPDAIEAARAPTVLNKRSRGDDEADTLERSRKTQAILDGTIPMAGSDTGTNTVPSTEILPTQRELPVLPLGSTNVAREELGEDNRLITQAAQLEETNEPVTVGNLVLQDLGILNNQAMILMRNSPPEEQQTNQNHISASLLKLIKELYTLNNVFQSTTQLSEASGQQYRLSDIPGSETHTEAYRSARRLQNDLSWIIARAEEDSSPLLRMATMQSQINRLVHRLANGMGLPRDVEEFQSDLVRGRTASREQHRRTAAQITDRVAAERRARSRSQSGVVTQKQESGRKLLTLPAPPIEPSAVSAEEPGAAAPEAEAADRGAVDADTIAPEREHRIVKRGADDISDYVAEVVQPSKVEKHDIEDDFWDVEPPSSKLLRAIENDNPVYYDGDTEAGLDKLPITNHIEDILTSAADYVDVDLSNEDSPSTAMANDLLQTIASWEHSGDKRADQINKALELFDNTKPGAKFAAVNALMQSNQRTWPNLLRRLLDEVVHEDDRLTKQAEMVNIFGTSGKRSKDAEPESDPVQLLEDTRTLLNRYDIKSRAERILDEEAVGDYGIARGRAIPTMNAVVDDDEGTESVKRIRHAGAADDDAAAAGALGGDEVVSSTLPRYLYIPEDLHLVDRFEMQLPLRRRNEQGFSTHVYNSGALGPSSQLKLSDVIYDRHSGQIAYVPLGTGDDRRWIPILRPMDETQEPYYPEESNIHRLTEEDAKTYGRKLQAMRGRGRRKFVAGKKRSGIVVSKIPAVFTTESNEITRFMTGRGKKTNKAKPTMMGSGLIDEETIYPAVPGQPYVIDSYNLRDEELANIYERPEHLQSQVYTDNNRRNRQTDFAPFRRGATEVAVDTFVMDSSYEGPPPTVMQRNYGSLAPQGIAGADGWSFGANGQAVQLSGPFDSQRLIQDITNNPNVIPSTLPGVIPLSKNEQSPPQIRQSIEDANLAQSLETQYLQAQTIATALFQSGDIQEALATMDDASMPYDIADTLTNAGRGNKRNMVLAYLASVAVKTPDKSNEEAVTHAIAANPQLRRYLGKQLHRSSTDSKFNPATAWVRGQAFKRAIPNTRTNRVTFDEEVKEGVSDPDATEETKADDDEETMQDIEGSGRRKMPAPPPRVPPPLSSKYHHLPPHKQAPLMHRPMGMARRQMLPTI